MKTKRTIIAITVFIALALVMAACGHSRYSEFRGASPEKRIDWVKKHISDELKLDAIQNAKLDEIAADLLARKHKMAPEREKGRLELAELVRNENLNRADLEQLVDKKRVHIEEMIDVVMDHVVEFHSMLTPEQRARLAEKIEKHGKKRCWR